MHLVYIYGPPAVGKLTVATELARRTGYKLFHNHQSIAAIEPIFEFGTPTFWRLVHGIRDEVMESAARDGVSLIYTAFYTHPEDLHHFERRRDIVERHDGQVLLVKLTCERPALEARVESESRRSLRKLSDLQAWHAAIEGKDVDSLIPDRESLVIDNTHLSPDEAAMRIIKHYALLEETNG
jgi:hypothetical protein